MHSGNFLFREPLSTVLSPARLGLQFGEELKLSNLLDFVLYLYRISDMHKDLCPGVTGLCDAMRPTKGADLLKYLRKVNFTGKLQQRYPSDSAEDLH